MRQARGFSIVFALFLVIVLGAIGAAAVTLSKTEQAGGVKSLLSAKVYLGAKAGLDWGIQQAVAANNTALCGPAAGGAGTPSTFTITQAGLANVSVTVSCTRWLFGSGNFVFFLSSVATIGTLGNLDYAERRLEATVSNIP
ncbi:MAG: hypothetical protein JO035_04825 [Betaproteobacteria bacterium]|nr:hypothetical protein [Betaproteobacteria bacterium]